MALLRGEIFFFELGHIGYLKNREFYVDLKKRQTYLSDKMPPKKLKLKNEKMELSKIRKQFFNFNFFLGGGHFVIKTS